MSETEAEYLPETPDQFEWSLDNYDEQENYDMADWSMCRIYLKRQEIALVIAQHNERITRLNSELARAEAFFLPPLQHWGAKQIAGQRRKSLILPHGTLQFRTVKAGIKIVDKQAAIAYAMSSYPDGLKYDLDVSAYKECALAYLADGELLPGIETTPEHESFSVRFGKEKEEK